MKLSVNDHLIETRNHLFNEINQLSFEQLNYKLDENTWSIAQICQHLFIVERASTQSIVYGLKQGPAQKVEPKPIQVALDRTQKLKAPEMVTPGDEPQSYEQIMEMLDESRAILFEVLDRLEDKSILAERSAKHPVFGRLPLNQWVEFIHLHEQRHIEQIKEVKQYL